MIAKQIDPPGYLTLRVLFLIQQERQRQHAQWGAQDLQPTEWLAILTEEVGEAAKSAFTLQQSQHDPVFLEDLREDLVQVAAVAVQWLESIERETLESSLTTIRHLRPGAEDTGRTSARGSRCWRPNNSPQTSNKRKEHMKDLKEQKTVVALFSHGATISAITARSTWGHPISQELRHPLEVEPGDLLMADGKRAWVQRNGDMVESSPLIDPSR